MCFLQECILPSLVKICQREHIKTGYNILLKNALISTTHQIIINKHKYSCALDIQLYEHLYYNVIDHPDVLNLYTQIAL